MTIILNYSVTESSQQTFYYISPYNKHYYNGRKAETFGFWKHCDDVHFLSLELSMTALISDVHLSVSLSFLSSKDLFHLLDCAFAF
jgi:hypothetical protein